MGNYISQHHQQRKTETSLVQWQDDEDMFKRTIISTENVWMLNVDLEDHRAAKEKQPSPQDPRPGDMKQKIKLHHDARNHWLLSFPGIRVLWGWLQIHTRTYSSTRGTDATPWRKRDGEAVARQCAKSGIFFVSDVPTGLVPDLVGGLAAMLFPAMSLKIYIQ